MDPSNMAGLLSGDFHEIEAAVLTALGAVVAVAACGYVIRATAALLLGAACLIAGGNQRLRGWAVAVAPRSTLRAAAAVMATGLVAVATPTAAAQSSGSATTNFVPSQDPITIDRGENAAPTGILTATSGSAVVGSAQDQGDLESVSQEGTPTGSGSQNEDTDPTQSTSPSKVTVRPGDSLWSIASKHLGGAPTARQIAHAWPQWWKANRELIGPDPGLIHPGQQLIAPKAVSR